MRATSPLFSRHTVFISACSAAILLCTLPAARAGDLASLAIIDQNSGAPLKIWRHGGKNYVAGQPGMRYSLQVRNKGEGRLLAVAAVDGINVINGETASPQQSGYVLSPWQELNIEGWRKSMHDVAAFYFTSVQDSYAGRTGRGRQSGVIAVALFREATPYAVEQPLIAPPAVGGFPAPAPRKEEAEAAKSGEAADAMRPQASQSSPGNHSNHSNYSKRAPETSMEARRERLGTGHGERIESSSRMTSFQRASRLPAEQLIVYYDSYQNLLARGIIPRPYPYPHPAHPQPFPAQPGFVPDPN